MKLNKKQNTKIYFNLNNYTEMINFLNCTRNFTDFNLQDLNLL